MDVKRLERMRISAICVIIIIIIIIIIKSGAPYKHFGKLLINFKSSLFSHEFLLISDSDFQWFPALE